MNILVIGNGFDLAHNLPTKYGDFLTYVKNYREHNQYLSNPSLDISGNFQFDYFCDLFKRNQAVYTEIEKLISNNMLLEYFFNIYDMRFNEGKIGWIDFEKEISKIIIAFDTERKILNEKEKYIFRSKNTPTEIWHYDIIYNVLKPGIAMNQRKQLKLETITNAKEKLIDDLNRITRCLEIYLCDYVRFEKCKQLAIIKSFHIDKVLSFNYTETYYMYCFD